MTTLAFGRNAAQRAKRALSGGFAGLLCLLVPGGLIAGTTLTYTGNAYPGSSGCSGGYTCNGTTPFLTFSFHTTLTVGQLANLTMGGSGQISATVNSWNVTDNYLVSLTQQSSSSQVAVNITTNSNGTPTAWTVASLGNSPVGNSENACSSSVATSSGTFPNCNASLTGDFSGFYNPSSSVYGSGGIAFSSPYNGTPGTWVVTADPYPTISIAPASPLSKGLVAVNPPSGLSEPQAVSAGEVVANTIATNYVQAVGWNLPAAATNVSIAAFVTSGAPVAAYLTTQTGSGTTVQNQIAATTFTGSSDTTGQLTTIFTGLNLAAGDYYLTLVSTVAANAPNVPYWEAIGQGHSPTLQNSAGGVTGLFQGLAGSGQYPAGEYPPASTFNNETGLQQGSPSWDALLFSVTSVQNGNLPVATVGVPYSQTMLASGGTGPYIWSTPFVQGGNLPPTWLSINSTTGTLNGTPTANGTFTFTVQATDNNGYSGQQTVTLVVNFAGTVITSNLPAGVAIVNLSGTSTTPTIGGNGASNSFNANGGTQTTWSGPFNSAGQLLEYTVPPGTYTMRVIDPADAAAAFPSLTTSQLNSMWTAWTYNSPWLTEYLVFDSSATSNNSQTQLFSGAAGSPGTSGPASAYADAVNGYVSGNTTFPPFDNNLAWMYRNATPQKTVTFPLLGGGPETLIFAVPDGGLSDNAGGVSILIAPYTSTPNITTSSLPNGQVGVAYTPTQLTASGGSGTYNWTATGLPAGLTVSAAGILSGTPTQTGTDSSIQLTATDPVSGLYGSASPSITIAAPSPGLTITTSSIPQGESGVAYSTPIAATGGYGAYTWRIASGSPPLSINPSTGVLSSSGPLSSGNGSQFTVTVADAAGDTYTSPTYTLLIDGAVTISTSALPSAAANESWATTIIASGGTTNYTGWSLTGQPSWLTISSAGVLSGVPPAAGTYPFSVTVTDSANGTYTANLSLTATLPVSYLVENGSTGGLVAVSGDGSSVVSTGTVVGFDVAADGSGNSVVANGSQLVRVTPFGDSVSALTSAPGGSNWTAVAADGTGNLIVGDNGVHGIWRVSADGLNYTLIANYPLLNQAGTNEDIKVLVDVHGNYIVAEDNGGAVSLFSITPSGTVTTVTLSGATLPTAISGLAFDPNGNYMLLDYIQKSVFQITPQGAVTVFATNVAGAGIVAQGLARNPLTNEYVVGLSSHALAKISANGSTVTQLAGNSALLTRPSAVLTQTGDFPSTVDATNPLAYFRLETQAGFSEMNAISYGLYGNATIASPGAPIGSPSNNYASLDGSSGYVSTVQSGGINTAGSIMAWVNLSVLPSASGESFNYIAGESQVGNDFDLQFAASNNSVGFFTTCCGSSIAYTPNSSTLVGQWHMVVATFDAVAGTRAIYWDGALAAQDNCPSCSSYSGKSSAFEIGNSLVFPGRYFPGGIDEVALWNYALTPAQVYRMYASRPPASGGVVTSLAPTSATLNSQTAVTITGQGFSSSCDSPCPNVWFTAGGQTTLLTPSSFGSSQIAVTIPASLLTVAGTAEIAVASPGGVPTNALPLTITGGVLSISPSTSSLPNAKTNQYYSAALTASGGSGNYSWSIVNQSAGLNLSLSATSGAYNDLNGFPTTLNSDGGLQLTVQLTDTSTGLTQQNTYNINVIQGITVGSQPSGTSAYILNEDGSLVTVTGGGASSLAPATGCAECYDMARDTAGNLIIAAGTQLIRYTSTGSALQAIPAPEGAQYFSVAVDSSGNYIVADNRNHQILRIAPNSPFASQVVASYPVSFPNDSEDAYVRVDSTGNYIVAEDNNLGGDNATLSLFSITPAGVVTSIPITPSGNNGGPVSTGGLTFDANGNYVNVDWSVDVVFTIAKYGAQNAGTATPLLVDPNAYLEDPEGIYRDPASGNYFLVDDVNDALYTFAPDGSNLSQISYGGLLTSPGSLVVVDSGPPPVTFTPATGTLTSGVVNQIYTQSLTASGGSGNYLWSITSQSAGLNLSLSATTGSTVSLTGTPTVTNFSPGLTITVQVTDTTTTLTQQQTYTIPVYSTASTTWTVSGAFNDGGSLTGTFTLNSSSGTVTNWNLVTTAGTSLIAFTYTPSTSSATYRASGDTTCQGPCLYFTSYQQFSNNGSPAIEENRLLDLSFLGPLAGGGTVSLDINNANDTASHECLDCAPYRTFTQGSATTSSQSAPTGPLPPYTAAYVLNENGSLVSVASGTPVPIVGAADTANSYWNMARDASGNLIIAAGSYGLYGYSVAGTQLSGFPIAASGASYYASVAVDSLGNYIVADSGQHQIARITPPASGTSTKQIVTSYSGNGDAIVRVDASGNYILATDNFTEGSNVPTVFSLFRITPAGAVASIPVAPTGSSSAPISTSGLTFDANGNYVIVDWNQDAIYTIAPYGAANAGASTPLFQDPNHYLSSPGGISRDPLSGDYFLVDNQKDAVYTLTPNGSVLTQVASGSLFSAGPTAVVVADAVASGETDYVAQAGSFTIAAIGSGTSVTCPSSICPGGFPNSPNDVVVDASGNFILASFAQLTRITPAGVSSVISVAPSGSYWISAAVDSFGYYIVADNYLHRLVRISPAGTVVPVANYLPGAAGELENAVVRVDAQGNYIVIEDNSGFHLTRISPAGTVTQITLTGSVPTSAGGLTFDSSGNYVIADYRNARIYLITPTGAASILYSNPNSTLQEPLGMYRDPISGNYLIADGEANSLFSLTPNGSSLGVIASGLARPAAVVSVLGSTGSPIAITPASLSAGTQGVAYPSVTLTATGGTGSYTWSATGLPPGMSLSMAGVLSGTPGASGSFTLAVTVVDTASHSATANLPLSIAAPAAPPLPPPPTYQPLTITTSSLPNGTIGVSYGSLGLGASGGSGIYSWSIGGLPAGLSGSAAGVITGTPTASGTFTVSVSVYDATANMSAQNSFNLNVAFGPLSLAGPANLGGFAPSAAVSASYTASGGEAPYKWSATGLPAGLSISPSTGTVSGSIAKPGSYSFTVQATDAEPITSSTNVSLFVLGIATTSLPDATNKVGYSQTLAAVGGNPPPYAWSVTGALPPGLSLSGSGVLSGTPVLTGTPTATQTFSFNVSVTAGGVTVSAPLSLNVTLTAEALSIPGAGDNAIALPGGTLASGYSQSLSAAGGAPPYSWSLLAGTLPPGLSLNAAGTVSGTTTQVGSFSFTAQVTDSAGGTASAGYSIAVAAPPLVITTGSPLPGGIAGTAYPVQTFTASGGNGPYTFSVQGALPSGLKFSNGGLTGTPAAAGTSSFTVTATDSSQPALTASSEFQIAVAPAHTDLILSATSLSFTFNAGAASLPAGTSSATVSVGSNGQTLGYSLAVSPAVNWLDVSGAGTTPGLITATLDPKALALGAGTVSTSIVVTCVTPSGASQPSPCAGNSQTIAVTLAVTSLPPVLSAGPDLLSYSAQAPNLQAETQSMILQNTGGGSITVNSITSPAGYVSFSGVPATLPANSSVAVNVIVDPVGLAGAYYQTSAVVNTSVGSATVPISLLVTQFPSMTLSPAGAQFEMLAGSSPGNPNGSFLVNVSTATSIPWTATVLSGAPWLQLNTTSGSSTSGAPQAVSYSIIPAATASLSVQPYYATIQVTAAGAVNSVQNYLVILNVAAATTAIQPDPEPAGLVFIATGPGAALPPQNVPVYASSPTAVTYSASSDSTWLSVTTGSSTASTGSPGFSSVSVNTSGLLPGVYRGGVSYQFTGTGASSGVRTVNVTLIVEGAATPAARTLTEALPQQSSPCSATQLVPTQTGLVNSFSQPASWPTPLTVFLVDNCGNPIANGQIVATFSNGDPPLALGYAGGASGNYTGTWTPRATSSQITISARATASGLAAQTIQIAGQVTPNATPLLAPNGTLNAFAPVVGAAVAPGTIVQIYGQNLAGQPGTATATPLPSKLNSTSVLIGGRLAPLYYVSPGQINAQIPFELSAGQQYQLIVNANGALSTPNPIQLSATAPGIAGFATGAIIAQHLDGSLVLDSSPAAPGEVIVFYLSGMGLTTQDVGTGAASPSTTLASPVNPPTITVGGVPVTNILFAGLTPTLVGLYQVDFQVPATVPNGDLPLVLTQTDGSSNTAVLPVHN